MELAIIASGFGGGFFLGGLAATLTGFVRLVRWAWSTVPRPEDETLFLLGLGVFLVIVGTVAMGMWGPAALALWTGRPWLP
jgi:queuine/archaeosine tRNA-ribosyltransferase